MIEITCTDVSGNPIDNLTQWDVNQTVYLRGVTVSKAPLVHFCNAKIDKAFSVQSSLLSDEIIYVKVPNILLQDRLPILLYVYQETGTDAYKSTYYAKIGINPKPQPDDYVYTENIDGINIKTLDARVKQLMTDMTTVKKIVPNKGIIEGTNLNFYQNNGEYDTLLFSIDISSLQ